MNRFMAALGRLIVLVVVLVAGAGIEYTTGLPFAVAFDQAPVAPPRSPLLTRNGAVPAAAPPVRAASIEVPIVSNARGAEDAQRADVPMGETIDLQRCYATMIARRLVPTEAKTVCAKLIGGITH